jgi:hypothetical protein
VCYITMYDGMNLVVNNQSMSYYTGGFYNYTFTPAEGQYSYVVESTCYVNNTETVSGYRATGVLRAGISSVDQIFEGTPTIDLLSQKYYAGVPAQVVLRLAVGSNSVSNAQCYVSMYNASMGKVVENQTMTHVESGLYAFEWVPQEYVSASYVANAYCQGGSLGSKLVQAAASLMVNDGVVMQSVS